jgi:cytochrome c553
VFDLDGKKIANVGPRGFSQNIVDSWPLEGTEWAFKQLDSMEARMQGCVTCHGQSGQGTSNEYFPRIAGKPAGYLYNQLVAFRDGTRKYAPMNYLVAYLPDSYLREMAEHFSKLRPPYAAQEPPKVDPAVVARGQSLVTAGDAAKGIPACIACHGAGLTGMDRIPGWWA